MGAAATAQTKGHPRLRKENVMKRSVSVKQKKRGRPPTGVDPLYGLQIPDTLILAVDRWASENECASRSDAIRRLLELGMSFSKTPPKDKH